MSRDVKTEFGRLLRQVRDNLGMSRADLAQRLGISPKTIQSWENGRTFIERLELIPRLETELGCSLSQLIAQACGTESGRRQKKAQADPQPIAPVVPRLGPLSAAFTLVSSFESYTPDPALLASNVVAVPFLAAHAVLGPVSQIRPSALKGHIVIPAEWVPGRGVLAAVRMADSAMSPLIPLGASVVLSLRPVSQEKAVDSVCALDLEGRGLRIRRVLRDPDTSKLFAAGCNGVRARTDLRPGRGNRILGRVVGYVAQIPLI